MGETATVNVNEIMEKAVCSAAIFGELTQEHTDRIVHAVYEAGFNSRIRLAKMAAEETGIGNWEHKVIKNVVATQLVYESIKHQKTVGIISEDEDRGIVEIAQPLGPIFAVIPVTNPTSTVLFKILIAMKTRNPIIIRPHSNAARCSEEAARICRDAALKADAPEDCIQWVSHISREQTQELMHHKKMALILATGGGSLVSAAYSSGTPALGVGSGNVPVFIEKSADIPFAVEQILLSKTFDNGTICASEQSLVVERCVSDQVLETLKRKKAYILSPEEVERVQKVAFDSEREIMAVSVIGKPAPFIAHSAGIEVPADTSVLIAPIRGVGKDFPLSAEILAPILAYYVAEDFNHAVNLCIDLNFYGGIGHTVSLFSNDESKIKEFALVMNAGRVVVNMPSSQGAVGGIYNTLAPSFTLGCGTGGKNITTDNISAKHLLNIQRITRRRINERWRRFDLSRYLDESLDAKAIEREYGRNQ
jgi:acetaldehyde dehydrogenase/alcohol dehydrogenase